MQATSKERQVVIHNDQWRAGKAPSPLARLTMSRGFEDGQGDIPMIHYAMQLLEAVHHRGKSRVLPIDVQIRFGAGNAVISSLLKAPSDKPFLEAVPGDNNLPETEDMLLC